MNRSHTGTGPSADQALLTFRMIGASLGVGVTLFAGVAWFAHQGGAPPAAGSDATLMFNVMISALMGAIILASVLWRARVAPVIERVEAGEEPVDRIGRIQGGVILVWAVIEAAALFAVVVYYLYGIALAGALGVVVIWSALVATWPKREWLEPPGGR